MKQTLGIYIRVSTQKQVDKGLSADDQQKRGIELAKQLGWEYKLYDDRGISATEISFRDRHLADLIKDCDKKVLDGIYCVDIDRWSRDKNYVEGQVVITLIKASGVQVFTPTGEYKLDDPSTEFMVRLKSLFASFETQNRRSSIIRNVARAAELGHAQGGAFMPYGYKKENKLMVIDEEEAKIVRWMYKQAFEGKGLGCKALARLMNEKEIPTRQAKMVADGTSTGMMVRGKKQTKFVWRDKTVLGILQNSLYKGERKHSGKVYAAPAIIEPKYWDAVQIKIKSRNQYKDTNNVYEYLLKGLIICPICGRRFAGRKRANGKDNCYKCMSWRDDGNCGNRGISIEYLNDLVCDSVLNLDSIIETALQDKKLQANAKKTKVSVVGEKQLLNELIKKRENIFDAIADGTVSKNVIKKRLDGINYEIGVRENKIAVLEKSLTIEKEKDTLLKVARDGIKEFKKMKTFNERAGFLATVIKQISVYWVDEYRAYDIIILFKINQMEDFLISREIFVNRESHVGGAVSKVLGENYSIKSFIQAGENGADNFDQSVDYFDRAIMSKPPMMGKNGLVVW